MRQSPRPDAINRADLEGGPVGDRALVWMLAAILAPYKWAIAAIFAMLLGVTLLSILLPWLVQQAVDGPIAAQSLDGLVPIGLVYFAAIIIIFVLRFAYTYWLQTVGQNALVTLRQRLYDHLLRQDMRFFNRTPVGQIVSRMSNDIEALTELLSTSIVMVISNLITLVGIIVVMLLINWRLALLSLAVLPVMTFATVFWRKRIREASNRLHRLVATFLAFLNENLGGMLVVQLFGRQRVSWSAFDDINRQYREVHGHLRDSYTWYASTLQVLTVIGLAIVLLGGAQGVAAGWATVGMLIAFIEYTRRTFDPVLQLAEQFAQIQTALAAGERIARMLRVEPGIAPPAQPQPVADFHGAFMFDHVTFSYEPGQPVLDDLTLQVPAGQRVAIVGATGAGKTSLAGLLARFYDVQQGRVTIDGVDVRQFAFADLRRFVTVVPQSPYCFDGTIADNLRLFAPEVSDEAIHRAAELSCAARFINRLPGGYDYALLPGAANLSQGQRQLIALARALLHHPKSILVLDEATSNIDTETEEMIQEGLQAVLHDRTSLIIAHRLSTVRDADRILVLQRGRIVEDGNHRDLLAKGGVYERLYERQFEEVSAIAD
ncbi:MAG TPA: ABC transporter ATP-binding protein [Candidatus Limnocylindrales bacterium]|nr:ABC transporter ATP-binding protein [Candidatus Limnocylindrales bacterium]